MSERYSIIRPGEQFFTLEKSFKGGWIKAGFLSREEQDMVELAEYVNRLDPEKPMYRVAAYVPVPL